MAFSAPPVRRSLIGRRESPAGEPITNQPPPRALPHSVEPGQNDGIERRHLRREISVQIGRNLYHRIREMRSFNDPYLRSDDAINVRRYRNYNSDAYRGWNRGINFITSKASFMLIWVCCSSKGTVICRSERKHRCRFHFIIYIN